MECLYLHDNVLSLWDNVESVVTCPSLLHLTMFNNGVVNLPKYRSHIVATATTLIALDYGIITDEDRAEMPGYAEYKTRLGDYPKIRVPTPADMTESDQLNTYFDYICYLKRKKEKCSPTVRIQNLWRMYKTRSRIMALRRLRRHSITVIQSKVRSWMLRRKMYRNLNVLLETVNKEYMYLKPHEYIDEVNQAEFTNFRL